MNTNEDAVSPEKRISEAKSRTQQLELRIAKFIPDRDVREINQLPKGSLQSCDSGDMWAGGITISLRADVRPTAALGELRQKAETAGFEVDQSKTFNGTERVTVSEKNGASVLLDVTTHGIEGGSFSECFSLPDDFYRGGEY